MLNWKSHEKTRWTSLVHLDHRYVKEHGQQLQQLHDHPGWRLFNADEAWRPEWVVSVDINWAVGVPREDFKLEDELDDNYNL